MGRLTRNFADVIRAKLRSDSDLATRVRKESFHADIAQKVHDLREQAGLSQKQLADRVQTQQSVICRIEDADYDDLSLGLLKQIGELEQRAPASGPGTGDHSNEYHEFCRLWRTLYQQFRLERQR